MSLFPLLVLLLSFANGIASTSSPTATPLLSPNLINHVTRPDDVGEFLLRENRPTLLFIHSTNPERCANCNQMMMEFQQAAKMSKGYVAFVAEDEAIPENRAMIENMFKSEVPVPMIISFKGASPRKPGQAYHDGGRDRPGMPYQGKVSASALSNLGASLLSPDVAIGVVHQPSITTLEDFDAIVDNTTVEVANAPMSILVFFTKKTPPPPLVYSLAHVAGREARVIAVQAENGMEFGLSKSRHEPIATAFASIRDSSGESEKIPTTNKTGFANAKVVYVVMDPSVREPSEKRIARVVAFRDEEMSIHSLAKFVAGNTLIAPKASSSSSSSSTSSQKKSSISNLPFVPMRIIEKRTHLPLLVYLGTEAGLERQIARARNATARRHLVSSLATTLGKYGVDVARSEHEKAGSSNTMMECFVVFPERENVTVCGGDDGDDDEWDEIPARVIKRFISAKEGTVKRYSSREELTKVISMEREEERRMYVILYGTSPSKVSSNSFVSLSLSLSGISPLLSIAYIYDPRGTKNELVTVSRNANKDAQIHTQKFGGQELAFLPMISFVAGNFRHFDPLEFQALFAPPASGSSSILESEYERRTPFPFHAALKPMLVSTSPHVDIDSVAALEETCKSAPCLLVYRELSAGALAGDDKYIRDIKRELARANQQINIAVVDAACHGSSASVFGLDVYAFPSAAIVRLDPKKLGGIPFKGAPTPTNVADFVKRVRAGGKAGLTFQPLDASAISALKFAPCAEGEGVSSPSVSNLGSDNDDLVQQIRIQAEREEAERRRVLEEAAARSKEIKREGAAEALERKRRADKVADEETAKMARRSAEL